MIKSHYGIMEAKNNAKDIYQNTTEPNLICWKPFKILFSRLGLNSPKQNKTTPKLPSNKDFHDLAS